MNDTTDIANLIFDEFGMIVGFKDNAPIVNRSVELYDDVKLLGCIITHIGHKQDYSITPHIRRRRPRWHNKKKR